MLPRARSGGPRIRPPVRAVRAAADQELAARRRPVHHAAAGLHRASGSTGADAGEPGHVPHPARRQRLRARARSRAALPNPPRHRRSSRRRRCGAASRSACNVFVGGAPAMMLAAVMPLPEGLSELMFAGALNRRRVRMARPPGAAQDAPRVHAEADFCLIGEVDPGAAQAGGPVRRSPRLLQPGPRLSRDARRAGVYTARTRSGRSPWSAGRRRKTPRSAS